MALSNLRVAFLLLGCFAAAVLAQSSCEFVFGSVPAITSPACLINFCNIKVYQTSYYTSDRIAPVGFLNWTTNSQPALVSIALDPSTPKQTILGFGGAFTEAAGYVWSQLNPRLQQQVISAYFGPNGNGYTVGRTHINSCDFSIASYSFDDTPGDYNLANFNTSHNELYIWPMIKAAMAASPQHINIFLSPWSPPAWMKANNAMDGSSHPGLLNDPRVHKAWALFFSKSIDAFKAQNIPVWGITVQNEPEFAAPWEACCYTAEEMRDFIADYLGPQLKTAHPEVQIMIYDHNKDDIVNWVNTIFSDPYASQYADGTAFHWYSGPQFENLALAHKIAPNKFMLATEACTCPPAPGDWTKGEKYALDILGDLNNYAVGWTDWNLLLDSQGGPNHLNNWCDAPIIAQVQQQTISFQNPYYYMGHISRFLVPGSKVIALTSSDFQTKLQVTAALTPKGQAVAVVMNQLEIAQTFSLSYKGKFASGTVPPRSIQTLTWSA